VTGRCVVQSVRRTCWLYNYKAVVACRAGVWPRCPVDAPLDAQAAAARVAGRGAEAAVARGDLAAAARSSLPASRRGGGGGGGETSESGRGESSTSVATFNGLLHAHHMSQIAPNAISRDLARAPRAAPERSPASPRPPVSWDMPVKTVGWVGEVRSRPRESSARPNCPDALNQIGELERFRLKTLRYTQPPMGRYWCCGMQAPMRRPEAPPDTLLGPTGPEKSPWSRSNLRLRLGIDSW